MITEKTKAILLFTSYLGKDTNRTLKPLTTNEWNRFALWLKSRSMSPEDLLLQDDLIINDFKDKTISAERLFALLERKSSLAIAIEKWYKAGVWILNRGDNNYPKYVKDKLKSNAPPIFFGIGNAELLNNKYIGVVGSRNTNDQELSDTKLLASSITRSGYGVVSGGAKGVDEAAMVGALENNGFSLGYVADSLIKKSTSSLFRQFIINDKLCLVSPFNPEAGFNVGNAMSRNKLIYAQSDATIVMKSDVKGGTWEGAKENLKKNWVPTWVIDNKIKGNIELVKMGAKQLSSVKEINVSQLIKKDPKAIQTDLFSSIDTEVKQKEVNQKKVVRKNIKQEQVLQDEEVQYVPMSDEIDQVNENKVVQINFNNASLFELFLVKLNDAFKNKTVTKKDLKDELKLTSSQLDEWLKMGVENEYLIKKVRPVTFMINPEITIRLLFN